MKLSKKVLESMTVKMDPAIIGCLNEGIATMRNVTNTLKSLLETPDMEIYHLSLKGKKVSHYKIIVVHKVGKTIYGPV